MKIKTLITLFVFITNSFFNIAYAQFPCETKQEKRVALFYANGMLNNSDDRYDSLDESYLKLKGLYKEGKIDNVTFDDFKYVEPVLAINLSETKETIDPDSPWYYFPLRIWGIIKEGFEVLFDWVQETPFALANFLALDGEVDKWIEDGGVIPDEIKKVMKDFVISLSELTDSDLHRQIKQYHDYFKDGYKVITIAHSHGNLISRKAYNLYIAQDAERVKDFSLLSVGSPVKMVGVAKANILDTKDPIGYFSLTLDPTKKVSNDKRYSGSFLLGYHNFLTYLHGSESSSLFDDFFIESIEGFDFSDSLFGDNVIEITLDKTISGNQNLKLYLVESFGFLNNNEKYYVGNDVEKATIDIGDELVFGFEHGTFESTTGFDTYTLRCDTVQKLVGDTNLGVTNIVNIGINVINFGEEVSKATLKVKSPFFNGNGEVITSEDYNFWTSSSGLYQPIWDNFGRVHIYTTEGEKFYYIHDLDRSNIEE